jgi:hypothetical protein
MKGWDELDAVVDGAVQGSDDPMLDAAARVRAAYSEALSDELAARHLALLAGGTTVAPASWKQWRARRALTIAAAAALSVVLLGGSAVAASSSALPGDPLYGIKRAAERLDLAVHGNAGAQARLHLSFAERRLTELSALLERRKSGESVDIGAAMSAYRDEVAHVQSDAAEAALGADYDALLAQILGHLQQHVDRLNYLLDNTVPDQARDAIQRAIDNAQTAGDNIGRGHGKGHGKPNDVAPSTSPGQSGSAPGRP